MKITKGKVVSMHYALRDSTGEILDSSEGQAPLDYLHGYGNIIAGLEKALENKEAGEKLNAVIPPEEGYGIREESLVKNVPLSNFQDPHTVEVGSQLLKMITEQ